MFMWKGTRVSDEPNYHRHEHLSRVISNPGQESTESAILYEVKEGDLLVINEGVYQGLAGV